MANPRKRRARRKLIEKKKEVAESLGISVVSKELLLTLPDEVVVEQEKKEQVQLEKAAEPAAEPVVEVKKEVVPSIQEDAEKEVSKNIFKRGRPKKQ